MSSKTRPTSPLKTRPGRNACGSGSPAAASNVSVKVRIPKDLLRKAHPVQVWPGSQGNDREAELDSEQI